MKKLFLGFLILFSSFSFVSCTNIDNGTYVVIEGVIDPLTTDITDNLFMALDVSYTPETKDGTLLKPTTKRTFYYRVQRDEETQRFYVQIPVRDYRGYVSKLRLHKDFNILLKQDNGALELIEKIHYQDLKESPQDSARFEPRYKNFHFGGVAEVDTIRIDNIN